MKVATPCKCGGIRRAPGKLCNRCDSAGKKARRAALKPKGLDETKRVRAEAQARAQEAATLKALLEENERLSSTLGEVQRFAVPPSVHFAKLKPTRGDAVACLIASDWHVEEPVERAKVHGLNEYSPAIAEIRARAFFRNGLRLCEIAARDSKIETVFLGLLGDFFSGYIHEELREVNAMGPAEAARFVSGLLASGIDYLLRESDFKLEIDCVPGNHGRMTLKPRIQNSAETSLEAYMMHSLAGHYAENPRVKFRVAGAKMLYRKFFERFTMRLIHGDDVKYGGGIGGFTVPIIRKLASWDQAIHADLTVMGHFHRRFDGGTFLVNGSLIGYNEFAQAIGASPEEAQQSFFLVDARGGGQKTVTAPVWLDKTTKTN